MTTIRTMNTPGMNTPGMNTPGTSTPGTSTPGTSTTGTDTTGRRVPIPNGVSDRVRSRRGTATMLRRARVGVLLALAVGIGACTLPAPPPPPAGSLVVVFDIDGTLTDDTLSSTPHAGAADAVNAYDAKGYDVVYVTARWSAVQEQSTRDWLASNGFPSRPLYMSGSLLVSDSDTVAYKTSVLEEIEQTGDLAYAYGDSSTDFEAYGNAGMPATKVYALKRASASSCQSGAFAQCLDGYTAHMAFIGSLPAVP